MAFSCFVPQHFLTHTLQNPLRLRQVMERIAVPTDKVPGILPLVGWYGGDKAAMVALHVDGSF
jgi:hypothetical protein